MITYVRLLTSVVACTALATLIALSGTARACAATSEIALLRNIPSEVLDRISFDSEPDSNGYMQLNRDHWASVVFQRVAIPLMWIGAAESDQRKVDSAWKAIDAAFAHQKPDGSFETADGKAMVPTDMAFWLEAVGHGVIVLRESSLGDANAPRISALLPKLRSAAAWLSGPTQSATLLKGDDLGTNRLFTDADAFESVGLLLGDESLIRTGRRFLGEALRRGTTQGVFLENGGFDSSYQAVSLLHASYLQLRAPSKTLHDAIGAMLDRELAAIGTDGAVDVSQNTRTGRGQERVYGHIKPVDFRSVILGLYYSGLLLDRNDGVQAASRVYRKTFHTKP